MIDRMLTGLAAAALMLSTAPVAAQDAAPRVRTHAGMLAGVRQGDVVSFKDIPYAAPPVGKLRWRPPQPVEPWQGVRNAAKYGAICEQKYNGQDNGVGALPMSEDCLTLNVFAPANAKHLPVMFWIHGGGFVNGSGTAALYDGSALARQGVVVVTINYRLGRFGFFAHPALTAQAKGEPVGNYGLMDMIAALKWVHANIAAFGGDPKAVTIFGESAGGIAVNDLMISPAARGLFVRAITESGLGREQVPSLAEAEKAGVSFAASEGLANASAADLRALTPEQILKAGDPQVFSGGGTIADGKILTTGPIDGFRRGLEAKVPYVVGWNSLEFPASAADIEKNKVVSGALPPGLVQRVAGAYPNAESYNLHLVSDLIFVEPAVQLARLHAGHGLPTYVYQFSVLSPAAQAIMKGTPHAQERQYVFQTLKTSPWPTDANDAAQAATMSAYWTAFARTGNPNGDDRPNWPAFAAGHELLDFTNAGPEVSDVPRQAAIDAISAAYR